MSLVQTTAASAAAGGVDSGVPAVMGFQPKLITPALLPFVLPAAAAARCGLFASSFSGLPPSLIPRSSTHSLESWSAQLLPPTAGSTLPWSVMSTCLNHSAMLCSVLYSLRCALLSALCSVWRCTVRCVVTIMAAATPTFPLMEPQRAPSAPSCHRRNRDSATCGAPQRYCSRRRVSPWSATGCAHGVWH